MMASSRSDRLFDRTVSPLHRGVKTRVCMISDTHDHVPLPESNSNPITPYRHPLPSADILLHAGDITLSGKQPEHQLMVDMMKRADAELKIIIAGNHDITLDEKYYNEYGYRRHDSSAGRQDLTAIRELYCGEEARKHGIVYMEEGLRSFTMKNGARFTVYATPYQPEFCRWAFAYARSEDRFNPPCSPEDGERPQSENPVPSYPGADIMLTHGPPKGFGDALDDGRRVGCDHLRRAVERARPRIHCFGHIHEGHGAERMNWTKESSVNIQQHRNLEIRNRCAFLDVSTDSNDPLKPGEETVFINAAIVTKSYDPMNAPWLVDIDLPLSSTEEES